MIRLRTFLAVLILLATPAWAQDRIALIADQISVRENNQLRAEGNVEILFEELRLRAASLTFFANEERLEIQGPLSIVNADGSTIFLADAGDISQDFRNGILKGARVVLDRQLQIAGSQLRRTDGRYTELRRAVATTCPVCEGSDVPLWQIRASRIVHDEEDLQIFYFDALLEVGGIPVFFLPRLRMPDPSVERATGFLLPEIKNSSVLGVGVEVPYFVTLGDHADVTLYPYLSSETTTMGLRYRQETQRGYMEMTGAVSNDQLRPDVTRGYLFGTGNFDIGKGYELRFDLELSSDDAYLSDYGISGQDRTRSDIGVQRTNALSHFETQAISFRSFRDGETSDTIPANVGEIDYRKKLMLPVVGGNAQLRLQGYGLRRSSTVDIDGRDYARITGGLDWTKDMVFGPGIQVGASAQLDWDTYAIGQDSSFDDQSSITATGAAHIALPLVKTLPSGVTHLLEPKLQFVSTGATDRDVPNEESTLVEFDEGSLFAIDRIPGSTEYETGQRLNAGIGWTRIDPNGWRTSALVGRVIRTEASDQFNEATGLSGLSSDWLVAGQLDLGPEFQAAGRILFDDDLSISRNDLKFVYQRGDLGVDANFLWQVAEPEIGRDLDTWELHADAEFPIRNNWDGETSVRYDFVTTRMASAGLALTYKSPCLQTKIGFERTFTSSASVTPRTDFTISLSVPPVAVASKNTSHKCAR